VTINFKIIFPLLLSLSLSSQPSTAATVKGVDIPEKISLPGSQQSLILNGAGIRSKFFFSIYIGALYLPAKQSSVESILSNNSPRRVLMYCLYDEISKDKLNAAWDEGFTENNTEQALDKLSARIKQFSAIFPALREGDRVYLDYVPSVGTNLIYNGNELGTIQGEDFNIALLKVWLGEHPADSDLKPAMLGTKN